jgi:hypothetical protein
MEPGNENMNTKFNLPVHKPDPDLWNRIESEMDYLEMVENYDMNVKEMPVHSPAERVWQAIESRLPFIPYYRRSYFRVGMVVIALMLVSFLGWIISQLIIDITPESTVPTGINAIQNTPAPEKPAAAYQDQDAAMPVVSGQEEKTREGSEAIQTSLTSEEMQATKPVVMNTTVSVTEQQATDPLFPPARDKPTSANYHASPPGTMPSYALGKPSSPSILTGENDYYMPDRKKGHYTLGAFTEPEYMQFTGDAPDNSALSTNYGLSLKYSWSTFFVETGLGYRQFTANSLYGINFADLQLLGSVLVVNEYQIVQYYNDEGELIIEKIYKPHFVQVYDTTSTVVKEETDQKYSFIDIPFYFGKVLYTQGRYAIALKGGARLNFPLKFTENAPVVPANDADLVIVEPIAVLASKFFVQFNLGMENRVFFADRGYFSFEPTIGYHQQSIEYTNEVKKQSSWSAGLRIGVHYQLK